MRETCEFDPAEQEEPTCPCGYELVLEFPAVDTPHESVEFCWNCRMAWGSKERAG